MALECNACGTKVIEGDAFCGSCGATIAESVAVTKGERPVSGGKVELCPSCEGALTPGERFCPWCGVQVAGVVSAPPPPKAGQVPSGAPPPSVGQIPSGSPPAAGAGAAGAFGQGADEVTERVKGAWANPATRLPIVFLASMVLGFVLFADVSNIGVLYPLVLGGVVFALLVLHATSPAGGDGPILVAAGIALVFSVLASLFGSFVLVALIASEGASFDFAETEDESASVTVGAVLALVGSVGLFLTTIRAYVYELLQRR